MKRAIVLIAWLALGSLFAGCTTGYSRVSQNGIGQTITFTTAEPAPADFDSWTFFWQDPAVQKFDADLEYVVLLPDGKEYYVHNCGMTIPGTGVRSDFWQGMFSDFGMSERDMIGPFRGQHISIMFRATKGRIRFPDHGNGSFTFYKKDESGQIDLESPMKQIDAVM